MGIVKCVLSYEGTGLTTPVCTVKGSDGKLFQLSSKMLLNRLHAIIKTIGEDKLGSTALEELGTHSIRSGATMAMFLASVPIFTIMLIDRWYSDAFLHYIRCQVQVFSLGVSCLEHDCIAGLLYYPRLHTSRRSTHVWKLPQLCCAFQHWPQCSAQGNSPKDAPSSQGSSPIMFGFTCWTAGSKRWSFWGRGRADAR